MGKRRRREERLCHRLISCIRSYAKVVVLAAVSVAPGCRQLQAAIRCVYFVFIPAGCSGRSCLYSRTAHSVISVSSAGGTSASLSVRGRLLPPETSDSVFLWLNEALPGDWGAVLDAGTGPESLKWLAQCPATAITAVTACEGMVSTVEDEVLRFLDTERDRIVLGNWQDRRFLQGQSFDVVIADYLLGSVDFFAPHFQFGLLRRLAGLVRLGGWLAITGKEPLDLTVKDPTSQLVLDVDALRDASMVLGRQRPYREMPSWWVLERLKALGLEVQDKQLFPRRLTIEKVMLQLDWAEEEIEKVPSNTLRSSLSQHLKSLRTRVEVSPSLRRGHVFGQDYAIVVRRPEGAR